MINTTLISRRIVMFCALTSLIVFLCGRSDAQDATQMRVGQANALPRTERVVFLLTESDAAQGVKIVPCSGIIVSYQSRLFLVGPNTEMSRARASTKLSIPKAAGELGELTLGKVADWSRTNPITHDAATKLSVLEVASGEQRIAETLQMISVPAEMFAKAPPEKASAVDIVVMVPSASSTVVVSDSYVVVGNVAMTDAGTLGNGLSGAFVVSPSAPRIVRGGAVFEHDPNTSAIRFVGFYLGKPEVGAEWYDNVGFVATAGNVLKSVAACAK